MHKKNIYVVQFGMGGTINLIPFAAGMLVSNLKKEPDIVETYNIKEIIFRREEPSHVAAKIEDCAIIAFGCSLWNLSLSLRTAQEVRHKFPEALILFGGSAVPVAPDFAEGFLREHPYIDMICKGEGEELMVELCRRYAAHQSFEDMEGIIYFNKKTGKMNDNPYRKEINLDTLSSPYIDGTFDDLWEKYGSEFSGVIMETTRGCPSVCAFCTWGFAPYRLLREKPMEQIRKEIEWVGKRKINYISFTDSNFGVKKRDVEIAKIIAGCKEKYGAPNYTSMSWVKNSSPEVVKIADVLRQAGIGFRVTLSLQSTNPEVLKAIKRYNLPEKGIEKVKAEYHKARLYCYTELILGLPLESYESFMQGIEKSLGETIFDQLFIYLLYLLPNTELGSSTNREKYVLESRIIVNRHQKNKEAQGADESAEVVVGTSTMPKEKWVDSFVESYYILALHDDRLAFFILRYLQREYTIRITDFIPFLRQNCREKGLTTISKSIKKLEACAKAVQTIGKSHFIEAEGYDGTPYDPCDAIFLELLGDRDTFYPELLVMVEAYLQAKGLEYQRAPLVDLFSFQEAIMAHPQGPRASLITLQYDWLSYFQFSFNFAEKTPLQQQMLSLQVVDPKPSGGDHAQFIRNHFNIRGVPAFNQLLDQKRNIVFPLNDGASEPLTVPLAT